MKQYISMELLEGLQRVIDHGIAEKDGTHLLSAEYLIKTINSHYVVTEDDDLDTADEYCPYCGQKYDWNDIETYADTEDN